MDKFRYFSLVISEILCSADLSRIFSHRELLAHYIFGKETSYKKCLLLGIYAMGNSSLQWPISVFHIQAVPIYALISIIRRRIMYKLHLRFAGVYLRSHLWGISFLRRFSFLQIF